MTLTLANQSTISKSVAFIADLHLSPETTRLNQQFDEFLQLAAEAFHTVYILGDLFCYWLGDDCIGAWHKTLAAKIKGLSDSGVKVYFMPGNRDFLMGDAYITRCGMSLLKDPTLIELGGEKVLLKHGDDLCTADKFHQWFRRFSRSFLIKKLYLSLNQSIRRKIAEGIRKKSKKRQLPLAKMQAVDSEIVKVLSRTGANRLIFGHTHQPMIKYQSVNKHSLSWFILPDWDKKHGLLYYNKASSYKFIYK